MELKGNVIAIPYKQSDMWADLNGVLISGGDIIDLVVTDHITAQGNWSVRGDLYNQVMKDDMYLARLYIKSEEGEVHPLKFNQWKSAIKSKLINSSTQVTYELLPSTFSEGYYLKLCVHCGGHFNGSKKQQDCQPCSKINRVAKLSTEVIIKRPRIKGDESTI
jgi:hypothetical protein